MLDYKYHYGFKIHDNKECRKCHVTGAIKVGLDWLCPKCSSVGEGLISSEGMGGWNDMIYKERKLQTCSKCGQADYNIKTESFYTKGIGWDVKLV